MYQLIAEDVFASTYAFRGSKGNTPQKMFPMLFEDDDDYEEDEKENIKRIPKETVIKAIKGELTEDELGQIVQVDLELCQHKVPIYPVRFADHSDHVQHPERLHVLDRKPEVERGRFNDQIRPLSAVEIVLPLCLERCRCRDVARCDFLQGRTECG